MKSTDVNVNDATIAIMGMATAAEVNEYIEGDARKGVLAAAEARITELAAAETRAEQQADDSRDFERPYATIEIPKGSDKNDQKTVTVNLTGTLRDGSNYHYARVFRRGMKEHNVPANVRQLLDDSKTTDYTNEEKADRTGMVLKSETRQRWPFIVYETYDVKKTDAEIRNELGMK